MKKRIHRTRECLPGERDAGAMGCPGNPVCCLAGSSKILSAKAPAKHQEAEGVDRVDGVDKGL